MELLTSKNNPRVKGAAALLDRAFSLRPAALSLAFQGGEPTLAGLDWFRRFLALTEERNRDRVPVFLSLQTNGTRIDGEWAAFLTMASPRPVPLPDSFVV